MYVWLYLIHLWHMHQSFSSTFITFHMNNRSYQKWITSLISNGRRVVGTPNGAERHWCTLPNMTHTHTGMSPMEWANWCVPSPLLLIRQSSRETSLISLLPWDFTRPKEWNPIHRPANPNLAHKREYHWKGSGVSFTAVLRFSLGRNWSGWLGRWNPSRFTSNYGKLAGWRMAVPPHTILKILQDNHGFLLQHNCMVWAVNYTYPNQYFPSQVTPFHITAASLVPMFSPPGVDPGGVWTWNTGLPATDLPTEWSTARPQQY